MKYKFKFYTQYNQFYIFGDNGKSLDIDHDWGDKILIDRLGVFKNTVFVCTESYGNIKGELVILEKPNDILKYDLYDHIVEVGIQVNLGVLDILDCPNTLSHLRINLTPGTYRLRVYSSNLDSVKESDLANDDDDDFYKIEIWPDDNMDLKVIKLYDEK